MDERNRNTFATASGGAGGSTSASSNSSFSSSVADTEDDQTIARILAEDESLRRDGMLGKRLSHLDSIPHTPRVNNQIPDINDATLDHELLSVRLATYGLAELQMEGDGNCQFRALADQLFRNPDYHKHVRKHIVKQGGIKLLSDSFLDVIRPGEWGDHVTLQAAADRFEAKICLVTSFREQSYIEILPHNKNPLKEAWLSFWSEVHYNSLYSSGVPYSSRCSHKTIQEEALALLGLDSYVCIVYSDCVSTL
ncbi:OVARIAN TUMOR DOMAIN-containing deubiquitinating enzyme 11 isoform X2 [Brassica rapa]|uniref:OVARIAN TUMOR DOMAIN-containing deubiquitinating enzyme 11 isoform X2 n=1 Tax=Brassica campestris TaxID=3711 RepID=UPI00142D9699|nr:OVARIAN TUMOR DOMAIN-containing deubiquitinating enzyme 11 isoform X2 [Brassica rapa]